MMKRLDSDIIIYEICSYFENAEDIKNAIYHLFEIERRPEKFEVLQRIIRIPLMEKKFFKTFLTIPAEVSVFYDVTKIIKGNKFVNTKAKNKDIFLEVTEKFNWFEMREGANTLTVDETNAPKKYTLLFFQKAPKIIVFLNEKKDSTLRIGCSSYNNPLIFGKKNYYLVDEHMKTTLRIH